MLSLMRSTDLDYRGRFCILPICFRLSWVFCFYLSIASIPKLQAQSVNNDTCLVCHGRGVTGAPPVDAEAFGNSIHGQNLCISCHRDAQSMPHPQQLAPVVCAQCHRIESSIYLRSDHGRAVAQGRTEAAGCKDCHGDSHTLLNSRNPNSPVNRRNIINTCAGCHADAERMASVHLSEKDPVGSYNNTIHGEAFAQGEINSAVCSDCHGTHDLHNALNPESRIFKINIPDTCGKCHQNVAMVYRESIHGQMIQKGVKEAPVCTHCHGEHTIRSSKDPRSPAWAGAVTRTCLECHASERLIAKFGLPSNLLSTYMDTYHGLAAQRGDLRVANCASCHGFHDILPSQDPRSSVNRANLSQTCGRCHPGAGHILASGYVHGPPTGKHWSILAARWFYLIIIPLALGFMLFHNGMDWLRKSWTGEGYVAHPTDKRLTISERIQHAVLIATFFLLAVTGFALKNPDAAWARYLAPAEETLRRSVHRWAALFFTLLAVYHAFYIAYSRRGRFVFREMQPRWKDFKDLGATVSYFLAIRKSPPHQAAYYGYAEKIEYWALIWGSAVMIATGGALVFNNITLKFFPLWTLDLATLIHYYEAILASLAILIWHFYAVIFDPNIYPINWAWLTGRIRRSHKKPSQ